VKKISDAYTKIGNYYVKPYNLNSNNSRSLTEENDRIDTIESYNKENKNLYFKRGRYKLKSY